MEQNEDLVSLRDRIETKVRRHLTKMFPGERADLSFETDFHGDKVAIVMIKSHRVNEIAQFRGTFRNTEAHRSDGFNTRDLTWTINAVLTDLGL